MDSSVISVKLDAFDGPLDLLLHLIEKNKIDIFDIPIVQITEQYLEIIVHQFQILQYFHQWVQDVTT